MASTVSVVGAAALGANPLPTELATVGGRTYFSAAGANGAGREPWATDGTDGGTAMVYDVNPAGSSNPSEFTDLGNGIVLFSADDGTNGRELWRTDGITTTMVADINPAAGAGSTPAGFTRIHDGVLFSADDGTNGRELWTTDGNTATLVKDINPTGNGVPIIPAAVMGGLMYFRASDGVSGAELWRSGGTAATTTMVRDIEPGPDSSSPRSFVRVGATMFFVATTSATGIELWKTLGTSLSTGLVADINIGSAGSLPDSLLATGDAVWFGADDGIHGRDLWRTTGFGAAMVKDTDTTGVEPLLQLGGNVLFRGTESATGTELWRSNGTSAGTEIVEDVNPGVVSSDPEDPILFDGMAYFSAKDSAGNIELWRSDGTDTHTEQVADINAGGSSSPQLFARVGDQLLFQASDGVTGHELWTYLGDALSNYGGIVVNDGDCENAGAIGASPFPSSIAVSGLGTSVDDVNVTIHGLDHTYVADVGLVLTAPNGTSTFLMRSAGSSSEPAGIEVTFDDEASTPLPGSSDVFQTSATFRPADYGTGCFLTPDFPVPAPTPTTDSLDVFDGSDPNGTWSLWAVDYFQLDVGHIDGWTLDIDAPVVPTDTTAPETVIDTGPSDPTTSKDAAFTFHGTDETSAAGDLTFECDIDNGGYSACASGVSYSSLGLGSHTFSVRAADEAGNVDQSPAHATWTRARGTTALLYTGQQIVNIGPSPGTIALSGVLSSANAAAYCVQGKPLGFAANPDPAAVSSPAALGSAGPTSAGGAAATTASTAGWQEGVYDLSVAFAQDADCNASSDTVTLTVATAGEAASGGGWYRYASSGPARTNFGMTVRKVKGTTNTYKGQLLLINNGRWRLKGSLTSFSKTAVTGGYKGAAEGAGDLYWWNAALNGGLGGWQLAKSGATFTVSFADDGAGKKAATPDTFGIHINYTPTAGQPSPLPNSAAQPLKGGDVKIS